MSQRNQASISAEEQLSELFGSYKAEWLRERVFDLFTEPSYFPELVTQRPCVLIGGRGTGKTTVLRGLSYEGRYALSGNKPDEIAQWPYYGFYYRVNTNRVTAFRGPELEEPVWIRLFAHYFNLVMCDLALRFTDWYNTHVDSSVVLEPDACRAVGESLHLEGTDDARKLAVALDASRRRFEAHINNVADGESPPLSLQGAPVDALFEHLLRLPRFSGKRFFFLLDEYENFTDYQQQVVNTLIKHSGNTYSFKVGVRELGWRRRATLNPAEQLISPADYVRINITEKLGGTRFDHFAKQVLNDRLSRIFVGDRPVELGIEALLPGLTEDQEAERLGIRDVLHRLEARERRELTDADRERLQHVGSLERYLIHFWSEAEGWPLSRTLEDLRLNRRKWEIRLNNYQHALLYTLRRGKRGIRKYYAGWSVFTQLAARNIRYLLELADQSLLLHIREGGTLTQPVSQEIQTRAAQEVGRKNLSELEGLSVEGARLTKLLLGLGRLFQVMAAQATGHAPEVNQFHLSREDASLPDASAVSWDVDQLLQAAVMHLALLRMTGNKLADAAETQDYDYMMHPIFSAFFVVSYRRKRKMSLSRADIHGLVSDPGTIREILRRSGRIPDEELPEQLSLFESYYDVAAGSPTSN